MLHEPATLHHERRPRLSVAGRIARPPRRHPSSRAISSVMPDPVGCNSRGPLQTSPSPHHRLAQHAIHLGLIAALRRLPLKPVHHVCVEPQRPSRSRLVALLRQMRPPIARPSGCFTGSVWATSNTADGPTLLIVCQRLFLRVPVHSRRRGGIRRSRTPSARLKPCFARFCLSFTASHVHSAPAARLPW